MLLYEIIKMRVTAKGQIEKVSLFLCFVILLLLFAGVKDERRAELRYMKYSGRTYGSVYGRSAHSGTNDVMAAIKVTPVAYNKVGSDIVNKEMKTKGRTNQSGHLNFPDFPSSIPNIYLYNKSLSSYRNPLLTFVHNPKSGGSTLKKCLIDISGNDNKKLMPFISSDNRLHLEMDFLSGLSDWKSVDLAAGSSSLGICENIVTPRRRCAYFTIVREPYDRIISHYFFCKGGGQTGLPCHNKSIEEYIVNVGSLFFRQLLLQVKCVRTRPEQSVEYQCHRQPPAENTADIDELVNYLVQKLDSFFAVIGLTEEYDTSLVLFQDVFKVGFHDNCSGLKLNTAPIGSSSLEAKLKHDLEKEEAKKRLLANETIKRILRPDIILYEKAKEIFKRQKQIFMTKKNIKKM